MKVRSLRRMASPSDTGWTHLKDYVLHYVLILWKGFFARCVICIQIDQVGRQLYAT